MSDNNVIERKAFIFNKQKYNMYDGPGVRTLVFFKGCPLRCKWCSNPEGLERKYQIMFKPTTCVSCGSCVPVCPQKIHSISSAGEHIIDRSIDCIGCGQCAKVCKFDAITVADNLCDIDYNQCKACGQCVFECPTGAIVAVNFSPKKVEPKKEEVTI